MKITIPYKPRNWAKILHASTKRWMCLVLHRRAGKTTAVINHLQRDALRVPQSHYAYIAPTYRQAKRIAWELLKNYSRCIPGVEYNESELRVKYPNFSTLSLFGSENVDALRGIGLWGCVLDENSQQPANIFSEVISKCLADHLGYCIWLGTPKGRNQFYRTYNTAVKNPDKYLSIFRTIDDSLRMEKGEAIRNLNQALADDKELVALGEMTQEEFDQEWYCSFEAAIKGAYYATQLSRMRKEKRIKTVPYDDEIPVHTVTDLGIGPNMAVGFFQRVLREMRMIDYWEGSHKDGLPQTIKAIKDKPYVYGKHFAPHDIKTTDMVTEKMRWETAKKLGIKFEVIPRLNVSDGIAATKRMLSRTWIDKKRCQIFLDYIAQYRPEWNDKRGAFSDTPYHDFTSHAADVLRGAAIIEKKMTNKEGRRFKQKPYQPQTEFEGGDEPESTRHELDEMMGITKPPGYKQDEYEPAWDSEG